jgi:hypothetical protein
MYDHTKFVTGIAVPVNIRDEQDNVIESTTIPLAPRAHAAFTLPSVMPATAGRQGAIEFMAKGLDLAVLSLRFDGAGFTPFPTLTNSVGRPATESRSSPCCWSPIRLPTAPRAKRRFPWAHSAER